jgi:hypothetical protein
MPGVGRVAKTHWQRIERSGRPPAPRIGRIGCVGLAGSALGDGRLALIECRRPHNRAQAQSSTFA